MLNPQTNSPGGLKASSWQDYLELCKPRVVLLMLLCATVGMFLATDSIISFDLLLFTNLGIALVAGSAASVNHIIDAQIDINMARTAHRPIAQGRVSVTSGILFSAVTGIAGISILAFLVNPLTAWLNLGSWIGYGIIYSAYLKRATPQNIVIGGLFGAAPPLFGWTAVTNQIDAGGVLLVMIIFTWTPPHFWALALDRKEEYAKVNIPMLPVTHGELITKYYILGYTLLLAIVTLIPFIIGMSGIIYLLSALALGFVFIIWSLRLLLDHNGAAIKTFRYSIFYLMMLFISLLIDHIYLINSI
jgi:protoheme IX farnesyltransferase|tara:strand:- start:288 stop:1196 length:909 start_codon:yes stop_codon:yes gene_type:complete